MTHFSSLCWLTGTTSPRQLRLSDPHSSGRRLAAQASLRAILRNPLHLQAMGCPVLPAPECPLGFGTGTAGLRIYVFFPSRISSGNPECYFQGCVHFSRLSMTPTLFPLACLLMPQLPDILFHSRGSSCSSAVGPPLCKSL